MTKIKEGYKETEIGAIPEDWDLTLIKAVCKITTGKKNTQDKVDDGIYPFFVRSDKIERINSYSFDGEAVLTAGDGVGTGKVFHYINEKFDIHQRVYKMTNFIDEYNGSFFYWYFSHNFYNRVKRMSAKTSVDSVRMEMIADMPIPIMSISEQHRIAEILSTTDAHIEKLDKTIEDYKLLKKGMMKKLLTEGICHTKFKETEIGVMPEAWEVKKLSEVVDVRDGTHDSPKQTSEGIPLITSKNLRNGKIDLSEITYISEEDHFNICKRSKVDCGDIIFAMIGTIGNPVIIDLDYEFSIKNVALLKFNKTNVSNVLIKNLIDSNIIANQFAKKGAGGVQKFVSLGLIRSIEIPIPPIEEQLHIAEILVTVDEKIDILQFQREDFIRLKKSLMGKLLTGKVRAI